MDILREGRWKGEEKREQMGGRIDGRRTREGKEGGEGGEGGGGRREEREGEGGGREGREGGRGTQLLSEVRKITYL